VIIVKMFGFRRKKQNVVMSVDDLSDSRARAIFKFEKLRAEEVFPLYRDLEAELIARDEKMMSDLNEPQDGMVKRLFCGAVLAYELRTNEEVSFFDEGTVATIKRSTTPEEYGVLGMYYEGIARTLRRLGK